MSEVSEAPVRTEASAGTLLRRVREASGLHIAALAVSLKVPVRKLEALEDDRYDEVGDAVFIRALAASVCRSLKVDPRQILERLPQSAAPRLGRDSDSINTPFRAPGDGPAPKWFDGVRQPVPAAVLALLVGAVILYFVPTRSDEKAGASQSQASRGATPPAQDAAPVVFIPAPTADALPVGAAASTGASAANAPASASAAAQGVAPAAPLAPAAPAAPATPVATANSVPPAAPAASANAKPGNALASAPAASAAAPGPASGIVVVRTRGESWVEVVDAKGNVAVRKVMAPGESAGATGALPLSVTIGRVDATEVEVRGRKFDMSPVSKDNVARFQVK